MNSIAVFVVLVMLAYAIVYAVWEGQGESITGHGRWDRCKELVRLLDKEPRLFREKDGYTLHSLRFGLWDFDKIPGPFEIEHIAEELVLKGYLEKIPWDGYFTYKRTKKKLDTTPPNKQRTGSK